MSFPTFTWNPDLGATRKMTPRVTATKFGDGYEMRTSNGINFSPRNWTVTFTRATEESVAIIDFLDARAAKEPFTWVDPMGKTGTYVCREWSSVQSEFGLYTVSATFEEVFEY